MATLITQLDNQAFFRFGGLFWREDTQAWEPVSAATDYGTEAAAVDAINGSRAPSDGVRIVNFPQIDLPPISKTE